MHQNCDTGCKFWRPESHPYYSHPIQQSNSKHRPSGQLARGLEHSRTEAGGREQSLTRRMISNCARMASAVSMVLSMFSFAIVMACALTCDTAESDTDHLSLLAERERGEWPNLGGTDGGLDRGDVVVERVEGGDRAVRVLLALRCKASRRALACSDSVSIRLCSADTVWSIAPSPSPRRVGGGGACTLGTFVRGPRRTVVDSWSRGGASIQDSEGRVPQARNADRCVNGVAGR